MGRHVCAFFRECKTHGCKYSAGGFSWSDERLLWKVTSTC